MTVLTVPQATVQIAGTSSIYHLTIEMSKNNTKDADGISFFSHYPLFLLIFNYFDLTPSTDFNNVLFQLRSLAIYQRF